MKEFNIYNTQNKILEQESVSVPWIQKEFGLSYAEAQALLAKLKHFGWVCERPEGINYKLQKEYMKIRKIEHPDISPIQEALSDTLITLLQNFIKKEGSTQKDVNSLLYDADEVEETINKALSLNLAYFYNERYFCCVSARTLEIFRRAYRAKRDSERRTEINPAAGRMEVRKILELLLES